MLAAAETCSVPVGVVYRCLNKGEWDGPKHDELGCIVDAGSEHVGVCFDRHTERGYVTHRAPMEPVRIFVGEAVEQRVIRAPA